MVKMATYFKEQAIGLPEYSCRKWQACSACGERFPMHPEQNYISACNGNRKHAPKLNTTTQEMQW